MVTLPPKTQLMEQVPSRRGARCCSVTCVAMPHTARMWSCLTANTRQPPRAESAFRAQAQREREC